MVDSGALSGKAAGLSAPLYLRRGWGGAEGAKKWWEEKVIVQWGPGVLEGSDSVVPLNGAPLNFFFFLAN